MLLAEKANRRVRIADEKKDEYIRMGYTVKNLDGSVIKAPNDPKKRVQELEAELKATREAMEKQITDLNNDLEKAREEAAAASGARMDLLESTRAENKDLKAENADLKAENADLKAENVTLKAKLEEDHTYIEDADKRITELEAELKKATAAEPAKKEAKTKQADN